MAKFIELGDRFGSLTVISQAKMSGGHKAHLCLCACGKTTVKRDCYLRNGTAVSCASCAAKRRESKHGMSRQRIYRIYHLMRYRCNNPNAINYKDYGGRGIKVCDEWSSAGGFKDFLEWATSHGYDATLTLDRIDVNGDYCPENCRWATAKEQANNRRNCRYLECDGERHTIREWSNITGLSEITIRRRIDIYGHSVKKALFTPKGKGGRVSNG